MTGFPPAFRVREKAEFDAVFATRRAAGGGVLVVHAKRNGLPHNRLGIVVGRKFGNAVARNRFKRLVRETFRLSHAEQPLGFDWVVLPKKPPPAPPPKKGESRKRRKPPRGTLADFMREFLALARRLGR